jgi:uncharacterized protein (TIGR03435 family)
MIGRILATTFVSVGMALAQTTLPATTAAPAKTYAFEVVSIRPNKSAPQMQQPFGPTADGYRITNMSLYAPLLTAYVPQTGTAAFNMEGQIKGLPDWFKTDRYDIDARIAQEDRAEWQKPLAQKVMLQSMLQAMFAERFKLAVHREVKESPVFSLVIAKGGIKFKETDPTVAHPGGFALPWGGVLVPAASPGSGGMSLNMYGATTASLATFLSGFGNDLGRVIQDKTGLTGTYDFLIRFPAGTLSVQNDSQGSASEPGAAIYSAVNNLGLKLEPDKGQIETLVIDHMERPSEN